MKAAVVAPAATIAVSGTVSTPTGVAESIRTIPVTGAVLEMLAQQLVELEEPKLGLEHCTEVTCMRAVSDRLAVALTPFRLAVTLAV